MLTKEQIQRGLVGWRRLAKEWDASKPGSQTRKLILAECRRCGYTPGTILGLHGSTKAGRRGA